MYRRIFCLFCFRNSLLAWKNGEFALKRLENCTYFENFCEIAQILLNNRTNYEITQGFWITQANLEEKTQATGGLGHSHPPKKCRNKKPGLGCSVCPMNLHASVPNKSTSQNPKIARLQFWIWPTHDVFLLQTKCLGDALDCKSGDVTYLCVGDCNWLITQKVAKNTKKTCLFLLKQIVVLTPFGNDTTTAHRLR